jgi:1-phosphatidylinositol-3-phosphate 5-kinase
MRFTLLINRFTDAKRILQEALSSDTRFLSSQSIMDYSLLLGLDTSKKELVAGLVDAIGSYGLFKTLESRGKLAIGRGEVTVVSGFGAVDGEGCDVLS